jgi:hypothetical protein
MREEFRVRVFESRVLRRIFGPMSNEVRVEWSGENNRERSLMICTPH